MGKNNLSIQVDSLNGIGNEISAEEFRNILKKQGGKRIDGGTKQTRFAEAPRSVNCQICVTPSPQEGFFIPGNVPSKKRAYKPIRVNNGQSAYDEIIHGKKSLHLGMAKQDHIVRYERESADHWQRYAQAFRELIGVDRPVYVQMNFIRQTKASRWDFNNLSQMVCDQMVKFGWIEDDNIENLIAVPPFGTFKWGVDKNNAGVLIQKLNIKIIDQYEYKAIRETNEETAKLTFFILENHPNIVKIVGKSCIDVAIAELKEKWGIV